MRVRGPGRSLSLLSSEDVFAAHLSLLVSVTQPGLARWKQGIEPGSQRQAQVLGGSTATVMAAVRY